MFLAWTQLFKGRKTPKIKRGILASKINAQSRERLAEPESVAAGWLGCYGLVGMSIEQS
jgi:hypothetical protein